MEDKPKIKNAKRAAYKQSKNLKQIPESRCKSTGKEIKHESHSSQKGKKGQRITKVKLIMESTPYRSKISCQKPGRRSEELSDGCSTRRDTLSLSRMLSKVRNTMTEDGRQRDAE